MTLKFKLELTGPPGSGKSAFIDQIKESCRRSKKWKATRRGYHGLTIERMSLPIPEKEEMIIT